MRARLIPGPTAFIALAVVAAILLAVRLLGVSAAASAWIGVAALAMLAALGVGDYMVSRRRWHQLSPRLTRSMPTSFALGVKGQVGLTIETAAAANRGTVASLEIYDHADPTLLTQGLPRRLSIAAGKRVATTYLVTPTRRGAIALAPADVRVRSQWRWCELVTRLGMRDERRVYPDFAQVARYAWLAGDRRLQEIGIKTYPLRGQGTDFKQLSEYRTGDSIRHLDWRATLRSGKPIVREFQDERDQCVMLLIDCGRRMRADDRSDLLGGTHFDQVLNAVMLLTYVALKQGDAVGAMTFGTPPERERSIAPRKGLETLNVMMGQLYDVQPTTTHSDYLGAAKALLRRHRKRSLVIVITNFRDEDSAELHQALRLLRSRHIVLLASIREKIVDDLMMQPLTSGEAAVEVAGAHLYEQSRRDAFNRLAVRDVPMVDAEPERLGVDLVNRYHAMKRAGTI